MFMIVGSHLKSSLIPEASERCYTGSGSDHDDWTSPVLGHVETRSSEKVHIFYSNMRKTEHWQTVLKCLEVIYAYMSMYFYKS